MVTIRRTRPAEAELLPSIERSAGTAFRALPELAWIADDAVLSTERHLELIAGGNSWVAVDEDDAPVGFLGAARLGDRPHIRELAVAHRLQGRGSGRSLIEHAAECAGDRGATALSLTTFRDVAWNQPFYERLGFVTLEADAVPADLRNILDEEAARGLPRERRCAMMRFLHGPWAGQPTRRPSRPISP